MNRYILVGIASLLVFAGCESAGPPVADEDAPSPTAATAEAREGTAELSEKTAASAEDAAVGIESTAAAKLDEAKQGAGDLLDIDAALDSSMTASKLKESVGSLSGEQTSTLADKLLGAFKNEEGIVAGLKEQISKLGPAELGKAGELKTQLETAVSSLQGLKDKLTVVVDQLKASGIDVSKFTSVLGAG